MKKLLISACLLILIFSMSCNEERDNISVANARTSSPAPDFSQLKSSNFSEEELVRLAADYLWFVRENLIRRDRTSSLTEKELNSLRGAKNNQALDEAINRLGGNGAVIITSFPDYRQLAKCIADQHLDVGRIAKLVARRITEKVYQRRFGAAKTPDCAGLCSQQFNIEMESCENELALEIGASLVAGAISGGMAGAGGLIISVGMYFNCESTAFMTLEVCSMNCSMN